MCEDMIMMSRRELGRYQMIERILKKEIRQAKVAELLELSERHVRRLVRRVRLKGIRGLAHGTRGRPSPRKMSDRLDHCGTVPGFYATSCDGEALGEA